MNAVKFLEEMGRICAEHTCSECPLDSFSCMGTSKVDNVEEFVEIVKKWSAEHPRKTRLQDFLEKYPDAPLYEDDEGKFPMLCPSVLGYCGNGSGFPCGKCPYDEEPETFCWNLPLEE